MEAGKTARLLAANELRTRSDFEKALQDLLEPLAERYAPGKAGFDLGSHLATYSPRTARMEGWSRVLWGVAPLLAGGGSFASLADHREGLIRGTDPADEAYWGVPGERDQLLVEMAAMALALMLAPAQFWDPLTAAQKENVRAWLASIQEKEVPENNWHFFRILVCSAFRRLGLPVDGKAEQASLDAVESMYRGEGWYVDGSAGNYDFYNPFGFHFYGLAYAALQGDRDPQRAAAYAERAKAFAPQFLATFREDGSNAAWGRSLTYRFAAASFFSACAFAGVEALPWGVMKGVVLRSLRSWFSKPIVDASGVLTVGYGYQNLVMAEQYNSPTSPYWGFKVFLPLALGADHPFWQAEEAPLPELPAVVPMKVPGYIANRSADDVQLLNPGRYPRWEAQQAAAKYGKFAYSARFGFCVSRGSYALSQTGCDSSLVLSEGDGYWRERRECGPAESGPNWTRGTWKPWPDVEITTTLVALGSWHLRFHRINSGRSLRAVEGGFSLPRWNAAGLAEEALRVEDRECALLGLPWAASRVDGLPIPDDAGRHPRAGTVLLMEPNLNILEPSALVPALLGAFDPGETVWACAVRAGDAEAVLEDEAPRFIEEGRGQWTVLGGDEEVLAEFRA